MLSKREQSRLQASNSTRPFHLLRKALVHAYLKQKQSQQNNHLASIRAIRAALGHTPTTITQYYRKDAIASQIEGIYENCEPERLFETWSLATSSISKNKRKEIISKATSKEPIFGQDFFEYWLTHSQMHICIFSIQIQILIREEYPCLIGSQESDFYFDLSGWKSITRNLMRELIRMDIAPECLIEHVLQEDLGL
ncbi:hypothetical protein F3J45_23020 [Pantoea sp. Ap-967]|uniref:hypothetical protein n=1 Tax=Pantoea sp. Ap-967 TaxID=2608362 RepID=UPI00141F3E57|nr:hypothetical protein [Pantoea sp. Ap-967]NIE77311.1 hypothetical protein [Pantoea sp. Ap-967]